MSDEEVKSICMKLCEFPELESIYLKFNENKLTNVGMAYLGKFLTLVKLKSLEVYLRGNQYDDRGAIYLVNQICKHLTLENLKISFWK